MRFSQVFCCQHMYIENCHGLKSRRLKHVTSFGSVLATFGFTVTNVGSIKQVPKYQCSKWKSVSLRTETAIGRERSTKDFLDDVKCTKSDFCQHCNPKSLLPTAPQIMDLLLKSVGNWLSQSLELTNCVILCFTMQLEMRCTLCWNVPFTTPLEREICICIVECRAKNFQVFLLA